MNNFITFAMAKASEMVCTSNHTVAPLTQAENGCIYHHTTLPLFYYAAPNKTNTGSGYTYGYDYSYDYGNVYTSSLTKSLTSNVCSVTAGIVLLNFNARLYDPLLGRFLSPDPYVPDPFYSQDYNKYTAMRNNPLIYVDEDGEWVHLVIGAIIGGVVNWATHGCQFNAKGLGYFGVGALAGALGAGVGAGISSSMAGGTFSAGFWGTSTAMTATSSFISGAAIGGGAGFSSGFTTGFGNGLLDGQNFGQALWSGTKYGFWGGLSGAAMGGLWSGFDAVRDGRDFWGGKPWETTADYSLPNGNLPLKRQPLDDVGCTQTTLESIGDYLGEPVNITDYSQGTDFAQLAKEQGFNVRTVANNEHYVGSRLSLGRPSAITYNNSGTMHTVGINRIQMQQVARTIGSGFRTRTIIQVMNPLFNTYQTLSPSLFRSGVIRMIIP